MHLTKKNEREGDQREERRAMGREGGTARRGARAVDVRLAVPLFHSTGYRSE